MPRHVENGQAIAEFLEKQPQVASVSYPGLKSSPYYELAQKYMPQGGCGVVSFELKGGRKAAEAFMKRLAAAGIPAGLVRISCGLEDKEDLIADLAQALDFD